MKERILTGWTFQRGIFLLLGGFIMIQGLMNSDWISVAFGGYFFSMGLFAFGCAAGNCYPVNSGTKDKDMDPKVEQEIIYEEIKSK